MRGELETEQTATYWPPIHLSFAALLSCSAGLLNRRSWGPIALCWVLVLSTAYYLQLTPTKWTCLSHRVIQMFDIYLLPVSVAFAPNSIRPRSRLYLDVFDRMHLFFNWRLGRTSTCYIHIKNVSLNRIKWCGSSSVSIKNRKSPIHCHYSQVHSDRAWYLFAMDILIINIFRVDCGCDSLARALMTPTARHQGRIGICRTSHRPDECGKRQSRSSDTPGSFKNVSGTVGILLK